MVLLTETDNVGFGVANSKAVMTKVAFMAEAGERMEEWRSMVEGFVQSFNERNWMCTITKSW